MIKRGQLKAERVHRPQGSAYLVTLPGHGADDETPTGQPAQDMSRTQGTPTPPTEAMVSLIQTTIGTILGPLVGQLDAQRQTIERQAEQLVGQAETIGALRARISTLEASGAPQAVETAPDRSGHAGRVDGSPERPRCWRSSPRPRSSWC